MAATPLYCTNHPNVETLLRCNRCNRPFCIRCLVRTPVGYRCKECLNIQQAGFYTATGLDYAIAGIVGVIASVLGGVIALVISGLPFAWLLEIFYAPAAGGAISEVIWRAISKHRGRYIWLIGCAAFLFGSLVVALFIPLAGALLLGPRISGGILLNSLVNLGFMIYLALAIGTVYARLR